MEEFETKVIYVSTETDGIFNYSRTKETVKRIEAEANMLGKEGWELVTVLPSTGDQGCVNGAFHYFKRRKKSE